MSRNLRRLSQALLKMESLGRTCSHFPHSANVCWGFVAAKSWRLSLEKAVVDIACWKGFPGQMSTLLEKKVSLIVRQHEMQSRHFPASRMAVGKLALPSSFSPPRPPQPS